IHRARYDEALIASTRGVIADLMRQRFEDWRLTPAEADVALFALKGCDIAQIADLRGSAEGTVRAQLARVYAKAGVRGQSGLIALFLDELIDPAILRNGGRAETRDGPDWDAVSRRAAPAAPLRQS